jgi:hypothetical protein
LRKFSNRLSAFCRSAITMPCSANSTKPGRVQRQQLHHVRYVRVHLVEDGGGGRQLRKIAI